jgi:hypothetical protein
LRAARLAQLLLRRPGLLGALPERTHANGHRAVFVAHHRRPCPSLPDGELAQSRQQFQRLPLRILKRHADQVHAHDDIASVLDDMAYAAPVRQTPISHQHVVGAHGKARQRLAFVGQRDLYLLARQRAQIEHVVQAPGRSCSSGLAHHAGIDQPHPLARQHVPAGPGQASAHLLDHPSEPLAAAAQTPQQGHVRHRCKTACCRANRRLSQRAAIHQMDQQDAQQGGRAVKAARADQRSGASGRLLPALGQHPLDDFPVLTKTAKGLVPVEVAFVHRLSLLAANTLEAYQESIFLS